MERSVFPPPVSRDMCVCHTCASAPPSVRLCPVSARQPPTALSLSVHPSVLSVSLSSPICLISSALILSISLSSHSVAQTPLSLTHPFFPLFIRSSVAADVNRITVCPLSLTGAILCLLSFHKSLTVMHHFLPSFSYQYEGCLLKIKNTEYVFLCRKKNMCNMLSF